MEEIYRRVLKKLNVNKTKVDTGGTRDKGGEMMEEKDENNWVGRGGNNESKKENYDGKQNKKLFFFA